jgi:hypothetical protein
MPIPVSVTVDLHKIGVRLLDTEMACMKLSCEQQIVDKSPEPGRAALHRGQEASLLFSRSQVLLVAATIRSMRLRRQSTSTT